MLKNILLIFIVALSFNFSFGETNLKFIAKKEKFKVGEDVCFEIINNNSSTYYLPSSAPWAVFSTDTNSIIYSPIAMQKIEKLKPGQRKEWCWKQIDINQDKVPTGKYKIRITLFDSKGHKIFKTITVEIVPEYKN